jgi:NAD(P)-dependent dehydrogenase (short-subunit alcohol dehydrogenase family)
MPGALHMSNTLYRDVILVVGAGSGIGKAVTELLLESGEAVVASDLDLTVWEGHDSGALLTLQTDVLNEASVQSLAETIAGDQLKLKGLVFTVGKAITLPLQSLKPAILNELLQLNTLSFFNLISQLQNQKLFAASSASIVVISSIVGQTGAKGKIAYSATKGALDAAIKSLACELAEENIRINAIAPGTLQTPMLARLISTIGADEVAKLAAEYPLALGYPEDVASLVLFLLGESAKWITGNLITIDGGFSAR